jgi:hypothetical protein
MLVWTKISTEVNDERIKLGKSELVCSSYYKDYNIFIYKANNDFIIKIFKNLETRWIWSLRSKDLKSVKTSVNSYLNIKEIEDVNS